MDPRLNHIIRDLTMLVLGFGGWILWFWVYFQSMPLSGETYIFHTLQFNLYGEYWWEFGLIVSIMGLFVYFITTQAKIWREFR